MNRISYPIGCTVELTGKCRTLLNQHHPDNGLGDESVITNVFFDTQGNLQYELDNEDTSFRGTDFRVLEYPSIDSLENAFDFVRRRMYVKPVEHISVITVIDTAARECFGDDAGTADCRGDGTCTQCRSAECESREAGIPEVVAPEQPPHLADTPVGGETRLPSGTTVRLKGA